MLREHEPQASVSTAIFEFSKLSRVVVVVQNFIKILFTDTSKTRKSGRHFVNEGTLLRYSLSITE